MSKRDTDLCKGIAILIMFFHHLFYDLNFWKEYHVVSAPLSYEQLAALAQLGKVCVAIFVFLSGYGTAKQYRERKIIETKKISEYTFTRYFKMMSHYWYIFIVSLVFSFLGQDLWKLYGGNNGLLTFCRNILIDFLGVANIRSTPTLCSTWWYMSYGILLVFFLPVLISFVRKYRGMISVVLGILLPQFLGISLADTFGCYLLSVLLGIICAEYDLFEYLKRYLSVDQTRYVIGGIVTLNLIFDLFYVRYSLGIFYMVDALLSMLICFFASTWISGTKKLRGGV